MYLKFKNYKTPLFIITLSLSLIYSMIYFYNNSKCDTYALSGYRSCLNSVRNYKHYLDNPRYDKMISDMMVSENYLSQKEFNKIEDLFYLKYKANKEKSLLELESKLIYE